MAPPPDARWWVALSRVPGLGPARVRRLLEALGTPEAVFDAPRATLKDLVGPELAGLLAKCAEDDGVAGALAWLEQPGNGIVTWADPDYPGLLLQISDPPPLLYIKGQRELLGRPALAIVGSRSPTAQGLANAEAFARTLSEAGWCVVSGLALGIDAAAHRGGLAGAGRSIAVMGTGLDMVYPARNRALAHELAERGLLVSEFPLGTRARSGHFPRRNRVLSGLARGCLVVEAALHSGSLITARMATEQGREVFAIPGSIHSPLSKGCHRLIKQGAKLTESVADILEELGGAASGTAADQASGTTEDPLLQAMGYDPVDVDSLAGRCGVPAQEVAARLLELELDGKVSSVAGGLFQRLA